MNFMESGITLFRLRIILFRQLLFYRPLADAMLVYSSKFFQVSKPESEFTIEKENIITEDVEFQEILVKKTANDFPIKKKVVLKNVLTKSVFFFK